MTYSIIQPPFTLRFAEMPKSELKKYYAWFMSIMPERIAGLESHVRETLPNWSTDNSPDSLGPLGEWFCSQVETRAKTDEEREQIKSNLKFPIEVSSEQLTNKTFSLAMDIGMYLAQVVLSNLNGTRWDQPLKSRNFADFGQPVLMGFGSVPLNPVQIAVTLAYGIARKSKGGGRLREVFDTWAKKRKD